MTKKVHSTIKRGSGAIKNGTVLFIHRSVGNIFEPKQMKRAGNDKIEPSRFLCVLSFADNDQDKKVVNNLVNTHKKNIIRRVSYTLAKPEEFTFKQLDYFDKVFDEFIGNDFDDTQELVALQKDIKKHKESARVDELSPKEFMREKMRDWLKSQSEEE